MAEEEDLNKGFIGLPAAQIPNAFNPRGYVTDNFYVKGAPQTFGSLDDLVAFHPFKMGAGMSATVINHPAIGNVSSFRLVKEPSTLVDDNKDSLIVKGVATEGTNEITFTEVWELVETVQSTAVAVYMYAPDGPGGGAPIWSATDGYLLENEHNWKPIFDANKGHRWMRIRTDDVNEAPEDGVFDNWTQPIRVGDSFTSGDYIENRFKRQVTDDTIHENLDTINTLIINKHYAVLENTVIKNINGKDSFFSIGYIFEYIVGVDITWSFTTSKLQETVPPPPRTINGIPNNNPAGWIDDIPIGSTDQLWQIWAQKSVYGQLKSDWRIKKINEDPDLIRYSNIADPHPDTIVGNTTPASLGSQGDLDLIAKGWISIFNNNVFMATREVVNVGTLWTTWQLQKIEEESGEYTDNVFKLFDLNADYDDTIALPPPISRDAISEGWSDTPILEPNDGTKINFISSSRKFFDGTLKTPWSSPVPYTGKDSWTDVIVSIGEGGGDDFKYNGDKTEVIPDEIILQAKLFKGLAKMWIANTITYVWKIAFNNGGNGLPDGTIAQDINTTPLFYYLDGQGIEGDANRIQDAQRVTIKPDAVDGKAVIRCTQTIEISAGNNIEFIEEFSILDITDGNDAKALVLNTDSYIIGYTETPTAILSPSAIGLRAYFSNLINQTWIWWIDKNNLGTWEKINARPGYTINGTILDFVTDVTNTDWNQDGNKQENRFAITNYDGGTDAPDAPSSDPLDENFRDIVTIIKLAGGGGSDGESAVAVVLTNEAHTVVLDSTNGSAQSGQVGSSSPALTKVRFYDGTVPKIYVPSSSYPQADRWSITGLLIRALDADGVSVNSDLTLDLTDGIPNDNEATVYIASWISSNYPKSTISAQITLTISYNGNTYDKIFTLGTSLDAPGAIILDIDSDKGFVFDVGDNRADKTLTAVVHDDTGGLDISDFYIRWTVENIPGSWGAIGGNITKLITHVNIRNSADVTCEISTNASVPFRRRTIRMSDVQDGKNYIFYNASVTKPTKPNGNGRDNSTLPSTTTGGTWYKSSDSYWLTNDPLWASDGNEESTDNTWIWSEPYRIGGETGGQGENGGFEMSMYKKDSFTKRADPASIQGLKNDSWTALIPTPTADSIIYITKKFYKGEYNDSIVEFDSNNEPIWGTRKDSSDAATYQLSLGTWSTPKAFLVTPPPTPANDGATGPGYTSISDLGGNPKSIRFNATVGATDKTLTIPSGVKGDDGTDGTDGVDGVDGIVPGIKQIFGGLMGFSGAISNLWGPVTCYGSRTEQGVYTINHDLGTIKYAVQLTTVGAIGGRTISRDSRLVDRFTVTTRDINNAPNDVAFEFVITTY